jgi:hypothetical protein
MTWSIALTIAAALVCRAMRGGDRVQRTWESDVRVRAIELSVAKPADSITARVTVTADRGDARAVRLEILLPWRYRRSVDRALRR